MSTYKQPLVSVVILDYNRPQEARTLLDSLASNATFEHEVVYLSNGGDQTYALEAYSKGDIDTLILNKKNSGCGLGTRQGFQAAMGQYVMYVQVDQWLAKPLSQETINQMTRVLADHQGYLYIDLAGNQGNGNPSERAMLISRERYLAIPGLSETIGGPGPYADHRWTENLLQEYMRTEDLAFLSNERTYYFGNNGKWSQRSYPCGGETVHATDTKILRVLKPLKQRYDDFPNLKLNDVEWDEVLNGRWPAEGKIPEADKAHSFVFWK